MELNYYEIFYSTASKITGIHLKEIKNLKGKKLKSIEKFTILWYNSDDKKRKYLEQEWKKQSVKEWN